MNEDARPVTAAASSASHPALAETAIDWVVGYVHPSLSSRSPCPDLGRGSSGAAARFQDNLELSFCVRTVRRHAPWIRRIYVVLGGDGPGPEGLAEDESLIFVPESRLVEWQPNSETKKLGYHLIPGLAPLFISSDDDMFLGRPLSPLHFFNEEGRPRLGSVQMGWDGMGHLPCPWRREHYAAAIAAFPPKVREHFLRMGCRRDNPWVPIAQMMRRSGCVVPGPPAPDLLINDLNVAQAPELFERMLAERPALICVNDDWSDEPLLRGRQLAFFHAAMERLLSSS